MSDPPPYQVLKPAAPAILPGDAHEIEVSAGASGDTGAGIEFDRMARADRQSQGQAQPGVALEVVIFYAVDFSASTRQVGSGKRQPDAGTKPVDEVSLQQIDRVLLARTFAEKIIVVREEPRGGRQLRRQRPPRLGKAEFRFKGPAVGAVVHQSIGIILAGKNRQLETRPDDRVLAIVCELL